MYKMLFLHTDISVLNKSVTKIVLHTCCNLVIPQIGIHRVSLNNEGIKY